MKRKLALQKNVSQSYQKEMSNINNIVDFLPQGQIRQERGSTNYKDAGWISDTKQVINDAKSKGYTIERPYQAFKRGETVYGSSYHDPENKRIFIKKWGNKTPIVDMFHEGSHAMTSNGKAVSLNDVKRNPALKAEKLKSEIAAHKKALTYIKDKSVRKKYIDVARENMKGYKAL